MEIKKIITRLLYFSVGISGLITAIIILVAPKGDAVGNAIATTFLILLADGIIITGIFARHEWLRLSTWAAAVLSLIVATIYTWIPDAPYYGYYSNAHGRSAPDEYVVVRDTFSSLTTGAYIIAFTLVFAALFSLIYKNINQEDKVMSRSYDGAMGAGVIGGIIIGIAAMLETEGIILRGGFAVLLLGLTSATIMFIALIIQSSKNTKEKQIAYAQQQEQYRAQYPQGQMPQYGAQGYGQQMQANFPQQQAWQQPQQFAPQPVVQQTASPAPQPVAPQEPAQQTAPPAPQPENPQPTINEQPPAPETPQS